MRIKEKPCKKCGKSVSIRGNVKNPMHISCARKSGRKVAFK